MRKGRAPSNTPWVRCFGNTSVQASSVPSGRRRRPWRGGAHGYDPRAREMQGIFVAAGPRLRAGQRVPAFDNIHVYAFLCALLNVPPAANDGNAAVTSAFLVK